MVHCVYGFVWRLVEQQATRRNAVGGSSPWECAPSMTTVYFNCLFVVILDMNRSGFNVCVNVLYATVSDRAGYRFYGHH